MPDRFVLSHIRRLPLFQRLDDEQLGLLSEAFQGARFEPGAVVFRQGEPSQGLYLFVSGRGLLVQTGADGVEQQVGAVGENQYINEAALFKPLVETASLCIVEPSVVLMLSRERLITVVASDPDLAAALRFTAPSVTPIPAGRREEGGAAGRGGEIPAGPRVTREVSAPKTIARALIPVFEGQREGETVLLDTRRSTTSIVEAVPAGSALTGRRLGAGRESGRRGIHGARRA